MAARIYVCVMCVFILWLCVLVCVYVFCLFVFVCGGWVGGLFYLFLLFLLFMLVYTVCRM